MLPEQGGPEYSGEGKEKAARGPPFGSNIIQEVGRLSRLVNSDALKLLEVNHIEGAGP